MSAHCYDEAKHLLIKGLTVKPGNKPEQCVLIVAHLTHIGGLEEGFGNPVQSDW
jgi:hypothetical protein